MSIKLGVRWDDGSQNDRLKKAKDKKIIDFIEVNYPIAASETPYEIELPIYAHSAFNGLCSAFGINKDLTQLIAKEAQKYNSPWVGEHLAWTAGQKEGALGYVFNSIYNQNFFEITLKNIEDIKSIYQKPVALELGPHYQLTGNDGALFKDEIDFLIQVARESKSSIILDLSHLIISNYNLRRDLEYGLDRLLNEDVIEIHVSGIRKSTKDNYWHDCHDILPNDITLTLLNNFIRSCSTVKAITFEHTADAKEADFFKGLEDISRALGVSYAN